MKIIQQITNFFKRNQPKDELKALSTKKLGIKERLQPNPKKEYTAEVVIIYEGNPLRKFKTTVMAYSRDNAAFKVQEGLKLKVISVHKNRKP